MKRVMSLILILAAFVSLTACGGEKAPEAKQVDVAALYETMQQTLPEMILMDEETMLNFFGLEARDCAQVVTAICADGLKTDEVWLIEAKDAAALERIQAMADSRLRAKADETVTYSPEQYKVVEKAQVLVNGNYLALLVSPDVDALKAAFEAAVQ